MNRLGSGQIKYTSSEPSGATCGRASVLLRPQCQIAETKETVQPHRSDLNPIEWWNPDWKHDSNVHVDQNFQTRDVCGKHLRIWPRVIQCEPNEPQCCCECAAAPVCVDCLPAEQRPDEVFTEPRHGYLSNPAVAAPTTVYIMLRKDPLSAIIKSVCVLGSIPVVTARRAHSKATVPRRIPRGGASHTVEQMYRNINQPAKYEFCLILTGRYGRCSTARILPYTTSGSKLITNRSFASFGPSRFSLLINHFLSRSSILYPSNSSIEVNGYLIQMALALGVIGGFGYLAARVSNLALGIEF